MAVRFLGEMALLVFLDHFTINHVSFHYVKTFYLIIFLERRGDEKKGEVDRR